MQSGHTAVFGLAEAVADGSVVDWDLAESNAGSPEERQVIQQLRRLASVTTLVRTQAASWGPLQIRGEVGRGTFGVVYRAWDPRLEREVALKLIENRTTATVLKEGRLLARIRHPNVVTVFGADDFDGRAGIWMEFLTGRTLKAIVDEQGPFGPHEAALVGREVCRALAAVHGQGVVHRDITAKNVMREAGGRTVLMDFGTGERIDGDGRVAPLAGTPLYLAPEVLTGAASTAASDVYSLGVLLYYLVSGEFPIVATSLEELRDAHCAGKRTALRDVRPDLPTVFVQAIERALEASPTGRYHTAGAFETALGRVLTTDAARGPCLAVLPFTNLSADRDNEYFSDGLTDELINVLSHIEGLRVVSRTSAFEFKGKALNVRTIGDQLGASAVLEGGVRRSGDRLRITVQLVNVSDGWQLWASRFDRQMTDIFDIQEEIAHTIAHTLEVRLTGGHPAPLVKGSTRDMEAYQLYLRGRFHWNKRTSDGFDKAREFFEAALARDPRYALAYAGLADYYISVASWGLAQPDAAWSDAHKMASEALRLDPSLADAHVSLAAFRTYYEWNWLDGEREFRRALELNPGDTNARVQYATQLIQRARLDEAGQEMQRALELDPLSATVNTYVAGVAYYARQYDDSLQLCHKALDLAPDDIELHCVLALTYEGQRKFDDAIATFERARVLSDDYPLVVASLAATYARAGQREKALDLMQRMRDMEKERYVPPIAWAWVHVACGELDHAFVSLEQAVAAHDILVCYLAVGPVYDSLRSDPRFPGLLRRVGLDAPQALEVS
jgi:eukaryotic-like serine/threonine-protein kinase